MAIHHETIPSYPGTLTKLADDLGNLRYDALALFLQSLHRKLAADATADEQRGRTQLATLLRTSAEHVGHTAVAIENAWTISAPFMPRAGDSITED